MYNVYSKYNIYNKYNTYNIYNMYNICKKPICQPATPIMPQQLRDQTDAPCTTKLSYFLLRTFISPEFCVCLMSFVFYSDMQT